MKAWRAMDDFHEDRPFLPWLLRIVANQTRNEIRSRKRRDARALRAFEPPTTVDPTMTAEAAERDRALLSAVRSLRQEERDVIMCRWLLGLSELETAQALDIRRGTVKSRASRALTRLRDLLDPMAVRAEVDDARG